MDAFAAQLQAAHAEAANSNYVDVSSPSTAVKHDYSNEMAIEEQSSEAVIPQQEKTGKHGHIKSSYAKSHSNTALLSC
eukprot:scaffold17771_cov65-Cyclotella_meneghiniana.AAC.3